jgi:hypothetical protein
MNGSFGKAEVQLKSGNMARISQSSVVKGN